MKLKLKEPSETRGGKSPQYVPFLDPQVETNGAGEEADFSKGKEFHD